MLYHFKPRAALRSALGYHVLPRWGSVFMPFP